MRRRPLLPTTGQRLMAVPGLRAHCAPGNRTPHTLRQLDGASSLLLLSSSVTSSTLDLLLDVFSSLFPLRFSYSSSTPLLLCFCRSLTLLPTSSMAFPTFTNLLLHISYPASSMASARTLQVSAIRRMCTHFFNCSPGMCASVFY